MSSITGRRSIAALVKRFADENKINGMVVGAWPTYARNPAEARTYCVGTTGAPGRDVATSRRTIWQIGSLTKTFTASILAGAVETSRLRLEDTVQDHVPSGASIPIYSAWKTSVPIRFVDLATHTGGLPADPAGVGAGGYQASEMYEYLANYVLAIPPGKCWNYSNLGYALLANVLIAIDNRRDYDDLLAAFKRGGRLDMPDTISVVAGEEVDRLAWGFSSGARAPWRTATWPAFAGSGGLYATLDDMLVWLAFNLGLTGSPLECVLPIVQKVYFEDGTNVMGLAWQYAPLPPTHLTYLNKGGMTNGFSSFIAVMPVQRIGVVVLGNEATVWLQPVAEEILRILLAG